SLFILLLAITLLSIIFFFTDTSSSQIYTLSLHDALPISVSLIAALISSNSTVLSLNSTSTAPSESWTFTDSTPVSFPTLPSTLLAQDPHVIPCTFSVTCCI